MVVSYYILTNISIEHFLNTATRNLFHSVGWSPGLNLNNSKWNMMSHGKSSCIIVKCVLYVPTGVISSYLVQSTREVGKWKYCVWARLMKPPDGQCLCTSLLVISDYAIPGATPHWFCKAGELTHLPLVPHICASVLDLENGSALVQVMSGRLFCAKPLQWRHNGHDGVSNHQSR